MKSLVIIFSIYFLGLSFLPCEDDAIFQDDATEFHQVDKSHASGTAADDCSPFCQCHCCHVHMMTFESAEADLNSFEISTKISEYTFEIGDDIPQSFFQPPRV